MRSTRSNPQVENVEGPILITFYSHKGGVGKTTSVHSIAHLLSKKMNYKVLLVDADPQCSLSSVVLRKTLNQSRKRPSVINDQEDVENTGIQLDESIHQLIDETYKNKNIYKLFDVLCEQKFSGNVEESLNSSMRNIELVSPDNENPNLLFLVGNKNFYKLEGPLTTALTAAETYTLYSGLSASLNYYLRLLGKKNNVDFVLIDLNPGSTILNASLLLGSDYFTVPIMPDHFSRQAIWSLSNIIPDWEDKFKCMRVEQGQPLTSRKLPTNPPVFLGIIPQRVKIFNKRPAKAYDQWLTNIYTELAQSFYRRLEKYNMVKPNFKKFPNNFIPRIDASIIKAQKLGIPVVAMPSNPYIDSLVTAYQNIIISLFSNMSELHHQFLNVANKFSSIGVKYHQAIKFGENVSSQVDAASASILPYPIPMEKKELIAFLHSKKNIQEFRIAVAKECMSIDSTTLASNSLKEHECVSAYYDQLEATYSEIIVILADICNDIYNKEFKSIRENAKIISQSLYENNIATNREKLDEYITQTQEKIRSLDYNNNDALETSAERLNQHIQKIEEKKDELTLIQNEVYELLLDSNFYEYFVSKWMVSDDSFISYNGDDFLINCIAKELGMALVITDHTSDKDEDNIIDDIYINYDQAKSNICTLKKSENGFKVDPKQSSYIKNHSFTSLTDYQYDTLDEYHRRWVKKKDLPPTIANGGPVVISVFNHKGGVAKTTTCQNIAFMLGKSGYRVLLVDTDTQCNLSSVMMGKDYHHFYTEQRASYNNENNKKHNKARQTYALLNQIVNDNDIDLDEVELYQTRFDGVFMLPGSTMHFVEVEFQLSEILQQRRQRDWKVYENASKIFERIASKFNFDVVIVDMCPSISSTNEMILMQSNFFIVPLLADYLSLQGIKSLPAIIKEWTMKHYAFCLNKGLDISKVKLPQLLQVIPQKYSFGKELKPTRIHQHYIDQIFTYADTRFVQDYKNCMITLPGFAFNEEKMEVIANQLGSIVPTTPLKRLLGIPDYNTFGLRAQESNDPICYTPYKNFKGDRTSKKAYQDKIDLFTSRYNEIVDDIKIRAKLRQLTLSAISTQVKLGISLFNADKSLIRTASQLEAETGATHSLQPATKKQYQIGPKKLSFNDLDNLNDDEIPAHQHSKVNATATLYSNSESIGSSSPRHLAFHRSVVAGDGNCGYTAFGITRSDAHTLVKNNILIVESLIIPVVKECLKDINFINYLHEKSLLRPVIKETYNAYRQATGAESAESIKKLESFAHDLNIIRAYVDYDILAKRVDNGWSHPCILQAIAEIRKIELFLWQPDQENQNLLKPHPHYPHHKPATSTERTDLLFVNNNHFDRLDIDTAQSTLTIDSSNTQRYSSTANSRMTM